MRLSPSRTLVQMISGNDSNCQWKRFHAPSSGYAMATFMPSGSVRSSRSSSGTPLQNSGATLSPK